MKRYISLILSLVLVLAFSGVAGAGQVVEVERPDLSAPGFLGFVPDEIVVRFAPGILKKMDKARTPQGRLGIPDLDRLGASHGVLSIRPQFPGAKKKRYQGREVDLAGWHQVKFRGKVDVLAVVKAYKARPGVLEAQPIGIHTVSLCPNDPYFDINTNTEGVDQWHLKKIKACDAFEFQTGNEAIIVAIPDTGVRYFHKDLGGSQAFYKANTDPNQNPFTTPAERASIDGNVWFNLPEKNGTDGVTDDLNDKVDDWVGWDFVEASSAPFLYTVTPGEDGSVEDNDPRDFNGHGTHCAGIIAALTNNSNDIAGIAGGWGTGFTSAGNGVKIMPLRIGWSVLLLGFLEDGLVRTDYAARALVYAADQGARIVSCSWGSDNSGGLGDAVDYFLSSGGLIFKAAGNDNGTTADYLCSRTDVISVAATDQNDYMAYFSNYGPWVDISAPGVDIWSLYHVHEGLAPQGFFPDVDYVTAMSGTSMASPLAAGVAALIWSKNPTWSAEQVKERLLDTADDIDALNPTYAGMLGAGRVNALAAVQGDSPPPTNEPPTANFIIRNITDLTVTFDASGSTDDGAITSYAWDFGDGFTGTGVTPEHTYAEGGTYTVILTVTDNGGLASDPATQDVTVSEQTTGGTMHVGDIDGFAALLNKKFWKATATVMIQDSNGEAVPNASVYGLFSIKRGDVTGVTDSSGQVSFTTNVKEFPVTFQVTLVTHDTLTYEPAENNETSITIDP